MSSVPSWTRELLAMGSPIIFYRKTDPNLLTYSGKGCWRHWVLTPIMPGLTTAKTNGQVEPLNKS